MPGSTLYVAKQPAIGVFDRAGRWNIVEYYIGLYYINVPPHSAPPGTASSGRRDAVTAPGIRPATRSAGATSRKVGRTQDTHLGPGEGSLDYSRVVYITILYSHRLR